MIAALILMSGSAEAQFIVSGKVVSQQDSLPIPHAILSVPALSLWAATDQHGNFQLKNVPRGVSALTIQCLGFVPVKTDLSVHANLQGLIYRLAEDNLSLGEVTITAKQENKDLNTSFIMDRTVLDHMQMMNVADASSLLPGGKTNTSLHLATSGAQQIYVIGKRGEIGNPNFGVAIEVDGVRLSNNAIPGSDPTGSDTRNIGTSQVGSIEVITGIPSVEHGDATNGIVRINSRKGASAFVLDLVTKPNTKQIALSKGVDLGGDRGILNFNVEHTRSISDLASPYTSYTRNSLSVNYTRWFGKRRGAPLELNAGLSGNIGGYNDRSDPDRFVNTYSKYKDNVARGNLSVKWQLNHPLITNIEFSGTFNYNDQKSEKIKNLSSSSSVAALHAMKEGYSVGQTYEENPDADVMLIQPGYWLEKSFTDSKLLNYSARIKANHTDRWGDVNHRLMAGAEYTGSGNLGRGNYYEDIRYAPTWRPHDYRDVPFSNNFAAFLEDRLQMPLFERSSLEIIAGLRYEATSIRRSVYGTVSNFSPRFNTEYTFWKKAEQIVENLSVKIGWGKTVKLPSSGVLFPVVSYRDLLTFAPGTTAQGTTYYAYYTNPSAPEYNPDLKWQQNIQKEIGINTRIKGTGIFVSFSEDRTTDAYTSVTTYSPFTYKFTDQTNVQGSAIPVNDRRYEVDGQTGIVSITDLTGKLPAETLGYKEITRFRSNSKPANESPTTRHRFQWIIDFKRIPSLRTQFRIDGSWYWYRGVKENMIADMPVANLNMADGSPYKFVGFYIGSYSWSNGSMSEKIDVNLTATTHIPTLRLIFSTRIEGSLRNFSLNLSEYSKGSRGFVLESRDGYLPAGEQNDIYKGDQFIGVYPEYYISLDDLGTKVPFAEKFLWARDHDVPLYNELTKLVAKTYYNDSFNPVRSSSYFSTNMGITKEIGKLATVTFNAINFLNNLGLVRNLTSNRTGTMYGNSNIPSFYYGLSLRLKW